MELNRKLSLGRWVLVEKQFTVFKGAQLDTMVGTFSFSKQAMSLDQLYAHGKFQVSQVCMMRPCL